MAKPLTILHLASWFPSRENPTLGNFVERHIEAIATRHRCVVLFAIESKKEEVVGEQNEKMTVVRSYFHKTLPMISYRKAMIRGYRKIVEMGYHPDLIHLHVSYRAGILALGLNLPYIISEHFSGYHADPAYFKWGYLRKILNLSILNRAAIVCPVSHHLGKAIQKFGCRQPINPISNVVDTSQYRYKAKKQSAKFRFLHISSFQEISKNITGLLRTFTALQNQGEDFTLAIGGSMDEQEVHNKIQKSGVKEKNVELLPYMSQQKVAEEMQKSDCFVLFSNIENQPVVLLEALCCGLPVIATDVGGVSEIIPKDAGILIPPRREDKLMEACLYMKYEFKPQPQKISSSAIKKYSIPAIAEAFHQCYLSALRSGA